MDPETLAALDFCYVTTKGRRSGSPHTVEIWFALQDDVVYLLAGGTEESDWVKNLRATNEARLQLGRKVETFHAEELADADKLPALRLYLKKWAWEVGTFFGGDVDKNSPDEVLRHIAPGVPVFKIHAA